MYDAGKHKGMRPIRVGEEIRQCLSEYLARGRISDPILFEASVTISEVRMSPDLRHAQLFVMPLGGKNSGDILEALKANVPALRQAIARGVRIKYVPQLKFILDGSFDYAQKMTQLMQTSGTHPSKDADQEVSQAVSESESELVQSL